VTNSDSDLVVALATNWMKQSCGCTVAITSTLSGSTYSVTVTVEDTCMGCDSTHIDLSPSAFSALTNNDLGLGVIDITWTISCPSDDTADQNAGQTADGTFSQPLIIGLAVGLSLFAVGIIVAIVVIVKRRKPAEEIY